MRMKYNNSPWENSGEHVRRMRIHGLSPHGELDKVDVVPRHGAAAASDLKAAPDKFFLQIDRCRPFSNRGVAEHVVVDFEGET